MIYSKQELVSSPDTFQSLRTGSLVKSVLSRNKKSEKLAALEIQFGFNLKKNNINKTKQLNLF